MDSFEQGLHDMFDHIWDCEIEHPVFQDKIGDLMQAVMQLYDTTTQPKMGWWIEIKNKRGTAVALRCSQCKGSPKYAIRSDYCPKCGSKMMQEVEE